MMNEGQDHHGWHGDETWDEICDHERRDLDIHGCGCDKEDGRSSK